MQNIHVNYSDYLGFEPSKVASEWIDSTFSDDNLLNIQKSATKFKKDFKEQLDDLSSNAQDIQQLEYQKTSLTKENAKELFSALRKCFLLRRELYEKFNDEDRLNYNKVNDKMLEIEHKLLYIKLSKKMFNDLKDLLNLHKSIKDSVTLWLTKWNNQKIKASKDGLSYQTYLLSIIQVWYEQLFDYLNKIEVVAEDHPFNDFIEKIEIDYLIKSYYIELIESSFVIETEPSQVIRSAPKIRLTLRCLAGKTESIRNKTFEIEMKILKTETSTPDTRIELTANESPLIAYDEFSQNLIYDGTAVIVVDKRKTKTLKVTDEMFNISFKISFTVKKHKFSIQLLSVPVVITVHTSQYADAYATVAWNNALSEDLPNEECSLREMTWNRIVGQIQSKHSASVGKDTRPLTIAQLNCLKNKVCGLNEYVENPTLTRAQFCINKLPGLKFSFWQWYYNTFSFIQNHFSGAFNDGYIMGYVKRCDAENLLIDAGRIPGMFLLRFSDSILNAISIVWVNGKREVLNHLPLTINDLPQITPLANIICNNHLLTFLYTEDGIVDKMEAFEKYTIEPKTETSGYTSILTTPIVPSAFTFNTYPMDTTPVSTANNLPPFENTFTNNIESPNISSSSSSLDSSYEYQMNQDVTMDNNSGNVPLFINNGVDITLGIMDTPPVYIPNSAYEINIAKTMEFLNEMDPFI